MSAGTNLNIWPIIVTLILVTSVPAFAGKIIYVDDDANGANDGSSWTDASNYLQDALADANSSEKPVEIRVAQGVYTPDSNSAVPNGSGDREASFQLVNGVTLKGGYAGAGAPDPNARHIQLYETVLSGDLNGNDVEVTEAADLLYEETREENSFHVVDGSGTEPTAILDGFLVVGGQAWSDEFQYLNEYCYGGGLYIMSGSPTVHNCRFIANTALSYGGGVHMDGNSVPVLVNCRFSGNSATDGGGLNSDYSSPTLTGCTFRGNAACSYNADGGCGGGLYNFESRSRITNCIFTGNSSDEWGGAGGLCNKHSSVVITNCTFANNRGGGGAGGGLVNSWSDLVLANCTFCGNSTLHGAGVVFNQGPGNVNISNCILWGNTPTEMTGEPPDVSYSNVLGGWTGQGNIDVDPLFVDAGKKDYHLLEDSPCIDAGDPNYIAEPNETDLDGNPRIINDRIDMGAYESPIFAEAEIEPDTLNLTSKGKWITAFIWLPEEYNVADIDPNSVFLEGKIQAEQLHINEQEQVAIAKFSREDVQAVLNVGKVELTITGRLTDGNPFEAKNIIKVIDKGGGKPGNGLGHPLRE